MDFQIDPNENEQTLQDKLNSYHEAFRQEFTKTATQESEPVAIARDSYEFLIRSSRVAAMRILWLSEHAENHSTQLKASQYIMDMAATFLEILKQDETPPDSIEALVSKLTKGQ